MSVSQQQRYANFNLYDIFANFLPGAVLVIGLLFPYVGVDGLFVSVRIGSLSLLLVLSFATGLFVQALGGIVQSSGQDFANHIQKVDRQEDEAGDEENVAEMKSNINISTVDAYFIETFRAELGLTSEFEDWNRLHKIILAKLEATSRSRALRLQALYLAMRGMFVTMVLLALWFIAYSLLTASGVFQSAVPVWTFPYLVSISLVGAGLFYNRGSEFSKDVAKYMVIEYYLEVLSQQNRSVELDFLHETDQETDVPETDSDGVGVGRGGGEDGQFEIAQRELDATEEQSDDDRTAGDESENGTK
ncbi:hypothetical protein [Halorussus amylolyticus]|uniref:hypothetical protein n=1 Tax=Halorussus amylolyticus TaxID=1126242 RepID=UPI00138F0488|nr:hypothetical protein [Halorussus amylolyticus]